MATADYDVVIVGTGAAGALVGSKLAAAGAKVLFLEAGDWAPDERFRYTLVQQYRKSFSKSQVSPYVDFVATQPNAVDRPVPPSQQFGRDYYVEAASSPIDKSELFLSYYQRMVGGAMWHWQGIAIRMVPSDFRMKTLYGVGADWPIEYKDLEPWYVAAERELGVAGNNAEYDGLHGAYRSKPFPMPAIVQTYGDEVFKRALHGATFQGVPLTITATPQARNSVDGYDDRPACEGYSTCVPLCPTRAKYEAVFHVEKAMRAGAQIRARSIVKRLEVDPSSGLISKVVYRTWENATELTVSGRIVVLAANGVEIPKILLYPSPQSPSGVANSSGLVGRYLMDHPIKVSYGLAREPMFPFRGPPSTSGIESFRDGTFRSERAAFRTTIRNDGWAFSNGAPRGKELSAGEEGAEDGRPNVNDGTILEYVRGDKYIGRTLRKKIEDEVTRQVLVYSAVEMLPNVSNRVTISTVEDRFGILRPQIAFKIDEYARKAFDWCANVHEMMLSAVGVDAAHMIIHTSADKRGQEFGSGHIIGTTVMGATASVSVVDADCRAHDSKNLFILGSSVFPTGAAANPTLTIAALALRAATKIIQEISSTRS